MARFTLGSGQVVDASGQAFNQLADLDRIQQLWKQYPGRAPGGTGATGLLSNDAQGWSTMLNEQKQALDAANEMQNKEPLGVKFGGYPGGQIGRDADVSTAGPGQTSLFQPALHGLQRAYTQTKPGSEGQAEVGSELQRRFPYMYGNKRGF